MSFRKARSMGVDFVYILPFAADQALIEVTSFALTIPVIRYSMNGSTQRYLHLTQVK